VIKLAGGSLFILDDDSDEPDPQSETP